MKKLFCLSILSLFSIQTYSGLQNPPVNHAKDFAFNATMGSALCAIGLYSAGETLLDCGHGYYELKKIYYDYLVDLNRLEMENGIKLSSQEKHFWAINQAISRVPRVFWREFIAGGFSLFTLVLGCKYLKKSI